ncbi:MAG: 5-(carboxyamino)imidazole ribonucleotide mutase [Euzebya sp.]
MSATPLVGITMGSDSDLAVMGDAVEALKDLDIPYEVRIVSAHRTPDVLASYGREASERGLKVIIAGAGGAAHLPGMLAAYTLLPVIGVPVPIGNLQGIDALLSIVQMPKGVPVATVAIGNARNAGLLAARILATADPDLARRLAEDRQDMHDKVVDTDAQVRQRFGDSAPGFGFTG